MQRKDILDQLIAERDRINAAITALEGKNGPKRGPRRRRRMSAEARRRISEGMKRRWASGTMKGRKKMA